MSTAMEVVVDDMGPEDCFTALTHSNDTALVDVRTRPEWIFTGLPDIAATGAPFWMVEWVSYPMMAPNPRFLDELLEHAGGTLPGHLFFLCRSGVRSLSAAQAVAAACRAEGIEIRCTNVREGFEGDLDAERHRGTSNGWKARGLPWQQT